LRASAGETEVHWLWQAPSPWAGRIAPHSQTLHGVHLHSASDCDWSRSRWPFWWHDASQGDRRAWEHLVDEYVGLIWAIARGHRLADGDAHDVTQTTWLRLVENIDRLSDPSGSARG
jgi:hypothetical protein